MTDHQAQAALDLTPDVVDSILEALGRGDSETTRSFIDQLHYADFADLLERVGVQDREALIDTARDDFAPEILSELDETVRDDVIAYLGYDFVAQAVSELDSDDAFLVVEEMEEEDQQRLLAAMPSDDRTLIEEGLSYPEYSAGRLMQREVVTVPVEWTVGATIDFMRRTADAEVTSESDEDIPDLFYDIFVVDDGDMPLGTIPLSRLLRTRRPVRVDAIMETEFHAIPFDMDQEDVAHLFSQRDLVTAPVVSGEGRLVGAITIDDVVDVIHEEHEEDIMRLGGVQEDDLYNAVIDTAKSRMSWLVINLGTAVLASLVIGIFETTIEKIVALAVLMPIVASMGGNAGTQTLTVAVRALATRELTSTNAMRVIAKELMVGVANGVVFAVLTGAVAWFWFASPEIGVIIGLAMVVNMIVAALAGTGIPIALDRFGVDPAVASSVFLTTVTDVVGFFVFLALAAAFLL